MPKRKRAFDEDAAVAVSARSTSGLPARDQRVVYKFEQAAARLAQAFKLAKGFERQKLGRRSKTAIDEKKEADTVRISAEIVALKTLDNAVCASHHLSKSLLKIKAIADLPSLPSQIASPKSISTDAATLNVHARLCNSNPVKAALPSCITDMQQVLGVKADVNAKKKRLRAKDYEEMERARDGRTNTREDPPSVASAYGMPAKESELESDDDFAEFEDRLASSDDENDENVLQRHTLGPDEEDIYGEDHDDDDDDDDDDEDLDIANLEKQLEAEGISRRSQSEPASRYDHAADMEITDDEPELESDPSSPSSSPDVRDRPRTQPQKAKPVAAPRTSSFIPSLSIGGYISGSDSDMDLDAPIDVAPRKNRPGQRARQQIWEKKYGTKAKHLSKPGKRSEGWDAKRGAVEVKGRRGANQNRYHRGGKPDARGRSERGIDREQETAVGAAPKKHRDDKGPIHPSWEAAKKAKEKRNAPVAFQGKKITFE